MFDTGAAPSQGGLRPAAVVAFALVVGVAGTFLNQYRYGFVNHLEQLPAVFRELDPTVMPTDYTVNELAEFGPRFYYKMLLASAARVAPLPLVYLVFTCLAHTATVLVTYLAALRLFARSNVAALLAATLVMAVSSIGIGGAAHLQRAQLVPQTLATPLLLLALLAALDLRPWRCVTYAALACLLHPLAGVHTGLLGLATIGLARLLRWEGACPPISWWRRFAPTVLAGAAFGAFVYAVWVLPRTSSATYTLEFLTDFARFRSPHHHLPSQFSLGSYAALACFVAAMALSWKWWYADASTDRDLARRVLLPLLMVFVLLVGGYLFVEVWPTRTWIMAQVFRLIYLVKWFGLLLFAATAARIFTRTARPAHAVGGLVMLIGVGAFQPGFVLAGHLLETLRRWRPTWTPLLAFVTLPAAVAALVWCWEPGCLDEILKLSVGLGLLVWLSLAGRRLYAVWAPVGALAVLIAAVAVGRFTAPESVARLLGRYTPTITLDEGADPRDGVARFAAQHTGPETLFVTPPYFGRFRVVAQRGLVVDYKSMPYDAAGYMEWRQRLRDCYGPTQASAGQAVVEMKKHYIRSTPEQLQHVGRQYGANYAILYNRTPTDWPVLYRDARYKLVEIPNGPGSNAVAGEGRGNAEVKSLKSKVRSVKSEVKSQKSEV